MHYDEVIIQVEKITPGTWIQNLFFLAKSYIGKSDKKSAAQYLDLVLKLQPHDENDKDTLSEARILHAKYAK